MERRKRKSTGPASQASRDGRNRDGLQRHRPLAHGRTSEGDDGLARKNLIAVINLIGQFKPLLIDTKDGAKMGALPVDM